MCIHNLKGNSPFVKTVTSRISVFIKYLASMLMLTSNVDNKFQ